MLVCFNDGSVPKVCFNYDPVLMVCPSYRLAAMCFSHGSMLVFQLWVSCDSVLQLYVSVSGVPLQVMAVCFSYQPVLMVSLDGFKPQYLGRGLTPVIDRLVSCGVHAPYMRSVYPTKTFPNHYTIATVSLMASTSFLLFFRCMPVKLTSALLVFDGNICV